MFARGRAIASGLLAVAVLAACATPPRLSEPVPPSSLAPAPGAEPTPAPPLAIAPPPAGPPAIFDEAAIRAEFGPPDFIRKESDSELWRYDGANCALFLFLYREKDSYLLRYRETLPRGASDPADAACIASIKARVGPAS